MPRPLNAKIVETARPAAARREIPDGAITGLYLIVQPSGVKSWAVRYRLDGKPQKLTLGSYPKLGLADARDSAKETLRIVSEGGNPVADKVTLAALRKAPKPTVDRTFERVLERFLASQATKGRRSVDEMRRILEHDALPRWRGRAVETIAPAEVFDAIEAIAVGRSAPVMAGRFRAWCMKFFNYCIRAQLRSDNPVKATESPISQRAIQRDRKLSDREIRLLWNAAERMGYPFGSAVQLLLLTGQRKSEVIEARWAEIDEAARQWVLPPARAKNNSEHIVFLAGETVRIVAELPRIAGSAFLFTTLGDRPISGISKFKERLDALIAEINGGDPIPAWRIHDLRRTFVSGCARLRIPSEVVERAVNHVSESFGGIRGVYNVFAYEAERRDAMARWATHVLAVVHADPAKVTPLRPAA